MTTGSADGCGGRRGTSRTEFPAEVVLSSQEVPSKTRGAPWTRHDGRRRRTGDGRRTGAATTVVRRTVRWCGGGRAAAGGGGMAERTLQSSVPAILDNKVCENSPRGGERS